TRFSRDWSSDVCSSDLRFYEPKGHLYIDDHLIHEYRLADLRQMVSLVLQDTVLFEGTLADNLRIGKPDATDEELWRVLESAQLEIGRASCRERGESEGL